MFTPIVLMPQARGRSRSTDSARPRFGQRTYSRQCRAAEADGRRHGAYAGREQPSCRKLRERLRLTRRSSRKAKSLQSSTFVPARSIASSPGRRAASSRTGSSSARTTPPMSPACVIARSTSYLLRAHCGLRRRIKVDGNPNRMILNRDGSRLFASADNSDRVFVIDTKANRIVATISMRAPAGWGPNAHLPGAAPNSLALSPDEKCALRDRGRHKCGRRCTADRHARPGRSDSDRLATELP